MLQIIHEGWNFYTHTEYNLNSYNTKECLTNLLTGKENTVQVRATLKSSKTLSHRDSKVYTQYTNKRRLQLKCR